MMTAWSEEHWIQSLPQPPRVSIGQYSTTGRKEANDDFYGVLIPEEPLVGNKGCAAAIADGMSGSAQGRIASETCIKTFLTDYFSTPESWTVKTSVGQVLRALNRWLHGQGLALTASEYGMVSTFTGLVLKSAMAHIFHVGDCRLSRISGGSLEPLTQDHHLRFAGGRTYLCRAMGADVDVEVDYRSLPVLAGDVFIFTTDGVHEYIRDRDILRLVEENADDLDAAARAIVAVAYEGGSPDNLTCQIVRIDRPGEDDANAHFQKLQERPFPPPLEPGMILDGYRILRELHASKRTQIYLAVDVETEERVALKTPSPNFQDDPSYIEMFSNEEWVGRWIDSPHVLKVRDSQRRRQFLYYVTEYVEGQSLRQWMHDHPRPSLPEVRVIAEQIAVGLRAFHRKEVIHQDLKPENILIDRFGTVKIIDFGSTRIAGLEEVASVTENHGLLGTIDYTAPEYLLGVVGSRRSDLFALGVIVYEMVTGKLPYGKGFATKRAAETLTYVSARHHNPDIPIWVDKAIAKAVHREPVRRYEALSEFLYDLSHPNPKFLETRPTPLIERNPVAFWRWVSTLLFIITLLLLYDVAT